MTVADQFDGCMAADIAGTACEQSFHKLQSNVESKKRSCERFLRLYLQSLIQSAGMRSFWPG
jgi:hypothetical protein